MGLFQAVLSCLEEAKLCSPEVQNVFYPALSAQDPHVYHLSWPHREAPGAPCILGLGELHPPSKTLWAKPLPWWGQQL